MPIVFGKDYFLRGNLINANRKCAAERVTVFFRNVVTVCTYSKVDTVSRDFFILL